MPTNARAAVQRQAGAAPVIENVVLDDPQADEVLVEIKAVGICHTDMIMRDAQLPVPMPAVLGHEGSGVVRKTGSDVSGLKEGDHVVLSFMSCGHCGSCDADQPAYCHSWVPLNFFGARADGSTAIRDERGSVVNSHVFGQSSFASHAIVNQRNTVKVDKDIELSLLGPLGCGIQTGAGAVLNSCKVRPDSSVAVIGTGAVGISAIMAAKIAGAGTIVALDINETRVELAKALGATHGYRADQASVAEHAAACGCALGFDYIFDTTGIADVVNQAILGLAPRGEIALVGAYAPDTNVVADTTHIMSGGRVIRGVVEGGADPQQFVPELIDYYRKGHFPFDQLVAYFEFDDIAQAIEMGETGKVIKPIIRF